MGICKSFISHSTIQNHPLLQITSNGLSPSQIKPTLTRSQTNTSLLLHAVYEGSNSSIVKEWSVLVDQIKGNHLLRSEKWEELYVCLPQKITVSEKGHHQYNSIEIVYDNYGKSLSEQIESRRTSATFYSEVQIWYLLLVLVLGFMQRDSVLTGHKIYQSCDMVIMNDQGKALIIVPFITTPNVMGHHNRWIYAPQELLDRRNRPSTDHKCITSFVIGMVVLCAGNLMQSDQMYTNDGKQLQKDELGKALASFGSRYNSLLYSIINDMTASNPTSRRLYNSVYSRYLHNNQFVPSKQQLNYRMRNKPITGLQIF